MNDGMVISQPLKDRLFAQGTIGILLGDDGLKNECITLRF